MSYHQEMFLDILPLVGGWLGMRQCYLYIHGLHCFTHNIHVQVSESGRKLKGRGIMVREWYFHVYVN